MRNLTVAGALLLGVAGLNAEEGSANPPRQRILVELFTSQG